MENKWKLKEIPNPTTIQTIQNQFQISPALATLFVQRGLYTKEETMLYFQPDLANLHDPFLMKNMSSAVDRFNLALANNEKIVIYGDYDVDGTTAVSLFLNAVKKRYSNLSFYIPDRFSEGYGVNATAVERLVEEGFTLMFTLDCGIKSVKEIELAKGLGLDVIVCDHHEPGETIPNAWVLNPKQLDCSYPYKELSGCGVTFKFLQAVFHKNQWNSQELIKCIDLLTLSIAADIVPLTGENRIFCWYGLQQINNQESTVIDLMFKSAKKSYPVTLTDVVFTIAPRLNAAGRRLHAKQIVELFTCDDLFEIETKIAIINEQNDARKSLDRQITAEAIEELIHNSTQEFSNVVYREDWSKGVIGIVASKLVEKNNRPTIVLTKSNGLLTGSGRSIPEVNLYDVLCNCETHLKQFGGHAFACGLTIEESKLESFKAQFDLELRKLNNGNNYIPQLEIDLEVDFDTIKTKLDTAVNRLPRFVEVLQKMEPFGPDNMRPVFITKNVYISSFNILKDVHLKFEFQQAGKSIRFEGIAFNFIEKFQELANAKPVDIVYSIGINRWNGQERVQLDIKDIRNSE
jgi:single-stranded-DNA-specific exonuclease